MAGKKNVKDFYVSDNLGKIFEKMGVLKLDEGVNAGDVNFSAVIDEEVEVIRRSKSSSAALAYLRQSKPPKVIYVAHWPHAPIKENGVRHRDMAGNGLPYVEQFEPVVTVSRPVELPLEEVELTAKVQLDSFLSSFEPDW